MIIPKTIVFFICSKSAIIVKGNMTLESGIIEANNYAVMAEGGAVTINGGSIEVRLAAITGNNLYGTMVFNVNGGTLSSKEGPAVYMPGPISYTMSDGTINGGLLFRMGLIDIKGGKINAQTDKNVLDDLKQYYNFNGYVNYPDALGVIAGTYTITIEDATNDLKINISGGEFTSNHGSAVAIYDFGKVAQNKSVQITGGKFVSNGESRNAYDILTLSDLGITNPESDYNKRELMGNIETTITGGSYNSDVRKYLSEDYVQTDGVVSKKQTVVDPTPDDEKDTNIAVEAPLIDTKKEVTEILVGLDDVETAKNAFTKALEKLNIHEENIRVTVDVKNLKEEELKEEDIKVIKDTLSKREPNTKLAGYFDIAINVFDKDNKIAELNELDSKIKFNIALPKDIKTALSGYTRTYYVVRYHNDEVDILNANLNDDKASISFESDKFSSYALIYKDTKEETVVPKTFDGIVGYLIVGAVTLLSILGLTKYLNKKSS